MNILLWIALIGVIVFFLGWLYSKFNSNAAQQPASKTIAPAVLPKSVTSPADNKTTENKKSVSADTAAVAPTAPATELPTKVKTNSAEIEVKQASDNKPAPEKSSISAKKTIPAAEPVGPAHSKSDSAPLYGTKTPSAKAITTKPAPAAPETEALAEPVRLAKPRGGKADDLTQITGIGKAIQTKLQNAGIYHYDQLVNLNAAQLGWINNAIGFSGRAERESWALQAKKLAAKSTSTTQSSTKTTGKATGKSAVKTTLTKAKAKTTVKAKAKPAPKASVTE